MNFKESKKVIDEVIENAWASTIYKEKLIANPRIVIEETTGIEITVPKYVKLIVEDQTDSSKYFLNIPRKVEIEDLDLDSMELSDEELEAVSGGDLLLGIAIGVAIFGAIYTVANRESK